MLIIASAKISREYIFRSFSSIKQTEGVCHTDILKNYLPRPSFVQRLPSLLKTDIKKYMYGLLRNIIDQDIRVHRYCKVCSVEH